MTTWLNPELARKFHFVAYRYRFLGIYVIIGISSLLFEFLFRIGVVAAGGSSQAGAGLGLLCGLLFAFWGNVRFNFKVPIAKRRRALAYFFVISVGSGILQFSIRDQLHWLTDWSYEQARLTISGSILMVIYLFHRRFSFRDYKRVGVAIYANGVEDIKLIFGKIEQYPDFIHVDIVDESFCDNPHEVQTYRMEVIRAYWPLKEIHTHVMSRTPSLWLDEILPFSDLIFLHVEINENVRDILEQVRRKGCKVGICLTMDTPVASVRELVGEIDELMLLSITKPGYSGQEFDTRAIDRIEEVNELAGRGRFRICVDGGVNERVVGYLSVEDVVSGSSVLDNENPPRQIMRMQTSSSHEAT